VRQPYYISLVVLFGLPRCDGTDIADTATSASVAEPEPVVWRSSKDPERREAASNGISWLTAKLKGQSGVPGGDPDGSGMAFISLDKGRADICFELAVSDIAPATEAHIYNASTAPAAEPAIALAAPTDGSAKGCVYFVDQKLIEDVRRNPENYYVNVHNADYPAGAVRGPLAR
jgi:hypothetical protein